MDDYDLILNLVLNNATMPSMMIGLLLLVSSAAALLDPSASRTHSWKFDQPLNGSTIFNGIFSVRMSPDALIVHPTNQTTPTTSICLQSKAIGALENYNSACFNADDYQWKHTVMDATKHGWIGIEATGWSNNIKIWVTSTVFYYSSATTRHMDVIDV